MTLKSASKKRLKKSQRLALISALELASERAHRARNNKLSLYRPYEKQISFHTAGHTYNERIFMAGNQVGKTTAGAAEWAIHLTGLYPDDWAGKKFSAPVRFWASGVTGQSTRDNPQRALIGPPADETAWGTGFIPRAALLDWSRARGIANAIDTVKIRHASGGISTLGFKSYEMGRAKWQGETLDGVWFDEEPPLDIYSEGLTRTQARGLFSLLTFTPLQGASDVVQLFLNEAEGEFAAV